MSTFKDALVRSVFTLGHKVVEHLPEILMVGGSIFTVTSYVTCAKSAMKTKELMMEGERLSKQVEEDIKMIEEDLEKGNIEEEEAEESIEILNDRVTSYYSDMHKEVAKSFAPSVLLMIGGFACTWGSYGITTSRYHHLASAYFIKAQEVIQLEKAVAAKYGSDALDKLKNGEGSEKVPGDEKNPAPNTPEAGETIKNVPVEGYCVFFQEGCPTFERDTERNRIFLSALETDLTNQLHREGIVFYNDLLEKLGEERVQDGYDVGWVYIKDPILATQLGVHNSIDLGIWDRSVNGPIYRFRPGLNVDRGILLRPNLDPIPIKKYVGWAKSGKVPVLGADGKVIRRQA